MEVRFGFASGCDGLASDTLVATPNGAGTRADAVAPGDLLIGQDGTMVEVESVQHLSSNVMYRIDLSHTFYEVSPRHLVTRHWSCSPVASCVN
jgi:hypothetical protein